MNGIGDEEAGTEHRGTRLEQARKRRPLEDGGMEGAEDVGKVNKEETGWRVQACQLYVR